jgi:hypothetical protein
VPSSQRHGVNRVFRAELKARLEVHITIVSVVFVVNGDVPLAEKGARRVGIASTLARFWR